MAGLFLEGLLGGLLLIGLLFVWAYSGVLLVHVILPLTYHASLWLGRCFWISMQLAGDGLTSTADALRRGIADMRLFIGIYAEEIRSNADDTGEDEDIFDDEAADEAAYDAALTLFGLDDDCDEAALNRAYKRAIGSAHPDRGGSAEQAQGVNVARDVIRRVRGWR